MIRRSTDIRVREVNHAQNGEGAVRFYDWLLPEEAPGHGRVFSKVVLPAGASIGYHCHNGEFEAFTVISGIGIVNDNGTEFTLEPGDMHICKNGDSHSLKNAGDTDLVIMALIMNDLSK